MRDVRGGGEFGRPELEFGRSPAVTATPNPKPTHLQTKGRGRTLLTAA